MADRDALTAGPPTVLSCFSGVGGLDVGLEAAGYQSVGCLEIDDRARDALGVNRPSWPLLSVNDVVLAGAELRPKDLGLEPRQLTLIAGGPPCQPFSKAAQWTMPKKGVKDLRGTAIGGMLKLVASFLPGAFLVENVPGFLSGANNAAQVIDRAFAEVNAEHGTRYKLRRWVVDAADYGVPQHRRRVIAIALRDGFADGIDLPITHEESDHRTAWDALGGVEPADPPLLTGKYADLLPCIPEGCNYQYLTARTGVPDLEIFGYRTKFWSFLLKLAKNQPAWTLPASPGPATGPFHWNNRPLSGSERLLLQAFPADWKLPSDERLSARLTGNATPPPLAEVAGKFIMQVLRDPTAPPSAASVASSLATRPRAEPVPEPLVPEPLPARWKSLTGPKKAHPGAGSGPGSHSRS